MVDFKTEAGTLSVIHGSRPHYAVALIAGGFVAVFGYLAFAMGRQSPDAASIAATAALGLTALLVGGVALAGLIRGLRRGRAPHWILRFAPDEVGVNLLNPGHLARGIPPGPQDISIPVTDLDWIRQATLPGRWDNDQDKVHVEMSVSDAIFHAISAQRRALRLALDGRGLPDPESLVEQFEGNVIRVPLDGHRWPEAISAYWTAHAYPTSAPFVIPEATDLASARATPARL